MKAESSFAKGYTFEEKVYRVSEQLLKNGDFGVISDKSYIHRKKKYPSKNCKNGVEVDISIETFGASTEQYSRLTIIECKNYQSPVAVKVIRELSTKLNEIRGYLKIGIA